MPGLLYADDLVLCGEFEEDLRAMVGRFEVCMRRGLKVNAGKSKVMVLNGEEGLECEVHIDGIRLEHVSEFKYLILNVLMYGVRQWYEKRRRDIYCMKQCLCLFLYID